MLRSDKLSSFDKYVVKDILKKNEFGINSVVNLTSLKSLSLNRTQYPEIEKMIIAGEFKKIEILDFGIKDFEYLEIMKFIDQNNNTYVVTIYDSDALEQNPEVMRIYKILFFQINSVQLPA